MTASNRIYADNSATSFPKPACVHEAMAEYAQACGASPGRGAYAEAREAGERLNECRERINVLIHGESPNHVIFTLNCSDALNIAIRGIVLARSAKMAGGKKPHVITTWMDHNSVLRPLNELASRGLIEQTRIPADPITGRVDPDDIAQAIRAETCLIAVIHGSNVTGTVQPIETIGHLARDRNIPFLVDAAQTLGHIPIDVQAMSIDLLAFPGHKGLLGPLGTGAIYIRPGVEKQMVTTREGGTGSVSEDDTQPAFMPDRFEPGSHNAIGLIGLSAGVNWILTHGVEALAREEEKRTALFLDLLRQAEVPGWHLHGPPTPESRVGVFSMSVDGVSPNKLAGQLESRFGILTRPGLHCAPLAHRTMGTYETGGTTRLSFGPMTTDDDVHRIAHGLIEITRQPPKAMVQTVPHPTITA